jgi:hypothetical protein
MVCDVTVLRLTERVSLMLYRHDGNKTIVRHSRYKRFYQLRTAARRIGQFCVNVSQRDDA